MKELVKADTLMKYHEEFVGYLHTREAVGICKFVDLWRICSQRM